MAEQRSPRTRLEQLLRQRHITLEEFRKRYQRTAGTALSERQAYRWVAGEVRGLPYPQAQATLERLFDEPVARLLDCSARRTASRRSGRSDAATGRCRSGAAHGPTGAPDQDRAFGDEAGTHSALAVARVSRHEIDGAAEALAPVLELPPPKRIHGIVTSVEHVRTALAAVEDPDREVAELASAIEGFTSERLAPQR